MPESPSLSCLDAPALLRVLKSLLAEELRAGGRAVEAREAAAWPDDLDLGAEGLALDSLERLNVASAANQLFHLHETGIEDYLLSEHRLPGWARIVAHALAEGTSGMTFATSGSTGTPKRCTHQAAHLVEEARFWAGALGTPGRIVALVPAHHIYGFLFTALLPSLAGISVIDARAMPPGRIARMLDAADLLVGFPAGLAALLRSLPGLPSGITVASSTAALPASTHAALLQAGAARVVEIYGSSETGGIAWRDDAGEAFRLLPRWQPGAGGEEASVIDAASGAAVPLPDRASFAPGGRLRLAGRKDAAVQVGGVNVHPARVAEVLRAHPDVVAAAVRADAGLVEPRMKAFIVARDGAEPLLLEPALRRWCVERLSAPERPVRFTFGAELPRTAMGKPADWAEGAAAFPPAPPA